MPRGVDEWGENHRNNLKGTYHMARLAGVDLPRNKRMEVALTYIYGIGPARSKELLEKTGISPDLRTDNLTDDQVAALRDVIENSWKVEGDLRREVQADIRRKNSGPRDTWCVTCHTCSPSKHSLSIEG